MEERKELLGTEERAVGAIRERLLAMQDLEYRDFQRRLMPTVAPERVIGVRSPQLRLLARELFGSREAEGFLRALPHRYYEEDNLHAFLLEPIRSYDCALAEVERLLPYVDNWATCDSMRPRAFGRNLPKLREEARRWLGCGHIYTVRFGIGMLMRFYLDDAFEPEYLAWVAAVESGEYYIRMMAAWYFATALAKQWDAVIPYLEQRRLDPWVHNKTVQKAVESFRITAEQKAYLRALKIR
ncbi:MAG: DNA alkylation repair protein [Oscillospiraceae bacterium]|nr:DNA alkylation repair protein [Oscillospiraceae bacterium]